MPAKKAKTNPQRKSIKKTVKKVAEMNSIKKGFAIGDKVQTISEIKGMWKGIQCEIKSIEFNGAVFKVKCLTGMLHGKTIRVRAADLEVMSK